ncbi:MAG: GDP-L-fucose synthase family protein [Bacteroidales bacterium]
MNIDSKIYVAGHKGLVGSAIWNNLLSRGYKNLVGRTSKELDLRDSSAVECFLQEERPEYIFLAAAKVGGIVANNTYRADFIYDNLAIQQNIIAGAHRIGVKKLLFLGSTCIYPREAPQPMREESLLTGPLEYTNEPYAIAKIAGLKMCESFNIQYGTNFISVMPTNLYGPNDNFDLEKSHVLPALIRKIHLGRALESGDWQTIRRDLEARPIEGVSGKSSQQEIVAILSKYGVELSRIEIWGSGRPMREFLWSEEMADACVYIMQRVDAKDTYYKGQKEIRNCHINVGTGRDISIAELSALIKSCVGYNGELYFNSERPDGTLKKLTDVSKLNALGWKHKIEIDQGVKMLYDWYCAN